MIIIYTTRCKLSAIHASDYEQVKALYLDERVRLFLGGVVDEGTFSERFTRMCCPAEGEHYWVVRHRADEEFVGLVSLDTWVDGQSTELSYQLLPRWWGQGLASEIVQAVIHHAFDGLGLTRIVAETQSANEPSCKLLRKVGMRLEQKLIRFGAEQSVFGIEVGE